jgi:hypothetical protein
MLRQLLLCSYMLRQLMLCLHLLRQLLLCLHEMSAFTAVYTYRQAAASQMQ